MKNIKVAMIDSGVSSSHKEFISKNIKQYSIDCESAEDKLGHGTAVAGIIMAETNNENLTLFSIKIFDDLLNTKIESLIKAIEKAMELQVDIINLSVGITNHSKLDELKEVCERAILKGIIIVAAAENRGEVSYPACWENVIGVESNPAIYGNNEYFYVNNSPIEFQAKGIPQKVAWTNSNYIIQGGNSFASPRITRSIAKILLVEGKLSVRDIRKFLKERANRVVGLESDLIEEYNRIHLVNKLGKEVEQKRAKLIRNVDFINKAVLFPFSKEMHQIVRYKHLLPFQLIDVYDIREKGYVGTKLSEIIQCDNDCKIKNIKDILSYKNTFDTIIIGYTHEINSLLGKDYLKELLIFAIEHNKNVYSFDDLIIEEEYADLVEKALSKGLIFTFPYVDFNDLDYYKLKSKKLGRITKPVVGVFGTGPQQGKFTTQLILREKFIKDGYTVGQLGTEHQSLLVGFDKVFPSGFNSNVFVAQQIYIPMINQMLTNIVETKDPDLLLVGSQSGTISYDPYDFKHQTSPTLLFLSATLPDLIILHINFKENIQFVRRTINIIENMGTGKVVAIVMFGRKKEVNALGRVVSIPINSDELEEEIKKVEDNLFLPVFNTLNKKEQTKLYEHTISFM